MARSQNMFPGLALLALGAVAALISCSSSGGKDEGSSANRKSEVITQLSFETANDALSALRIAADENDLEYLREIFGPEASELSSDDPERDNAERLRFAAAMREFCELRPIEGGVGGFHVIVGASRIEFPVPLMQHDGRWMFDTLAGVEAMIDYRVGVNEIRTLAAMRDLPGLQREYFAVDRDGDGIQEYAQRMRSSPGMRDGLYWESRDNEPDSPLGPYAANAAEAYQEGLGYNGYEYRILTGQGAGAPGGARSYMKGKDMVHGFAFIAVPAIYDRTGVMTFIVGPDGVVYEKDLGPNTKGVAAAISLFDPAGWSKSED
ncbi:MAG: DUF2950 family protein [Phycisphaeraceae bacterium]|nr:DUF2950 family protein [Phycisphaerae bacterium]MBX3393513.1 DUF2950 family protein [Phycisphaeraceae bacterium]